MKRTALPALLLVSQHRSQDEITEEDEVFILDVINETALQMAPADEGEQIAPVIGLAARTPEDQTALKLLRVAVGAKTMTLVPLGLSAEDAVNETIEQRPVAVCIGAISPTRGAEVRNFCQQAGLIGLTVAEALDALVRAPEALEPIMPDLPEQFARDVPAWLRGPFADARNRLRLAHAERFDLVPRHALLLGFKTR